MALEVGDNVLVPVSTHLLGVAVGFTGVIDEACQTHCTINEAVQVKDQLFSVSEERPA